MSGKDLSSSISSMVTKLPIPSSQKNNITQDYIGESPEQEKADAGTLKDTLAGNAPAAPISVPVTPTISTKPALTPTADTTEGAPEKGLMNTMDILDFITKGIVSIPNSIVGQELHPSPEEMSMEDIAGLNAPESMGLPSSLDFGRAIAKGAMRFWNPITQGYANDLSDAMLAYTKGTADASGMSTLAGAISGIYKKVYSNASGHDITMKEIDDLPTMQKSWQQVVGDATQIVLSAYTPALIGEGAAGDASKGIIDALTTGAKTSAINAGVPFGLAQVMSQGTTDPKQIASIMFNNIVGMAALGAITHGLVPIGKAAFQAATKDVIESYHLPENISMQGDEVYKIYAGITNTGERRDFLMSLNLTADEIRTASKEGISITVPTEKIVTVSDKPWFAKLKKSIGLTETFQQFKEGDPAQQRSGFGGYLPENAGESGTGAPEGNPSVPEAPEQPESPQAAIQAAKSELGITTAPAEAPIVPEEPKAALATTPEGIEQAIQTAKEAITTKQATIDKEAADKSAAVRDEITKGKSLTADQNLGPREHIVFQNAYEEVQDKAGLESDQLKSLPPDISVKDALKTIFGSGIIGNEDETAAQIVAGLTKLGYKDLPQELTGSLKQEAPIEKTEDGKIELKPNENDEATKVLANLEAGAAAYVSGNENKLKEQYRKKHGTYFNVDRMKELIPGHKENVTRSEAFHKPAAKLMGEMVREAIETAEKGAHVRVLAGSPASGKTTAVEKLIQPGSDATKNEIVIDGTLASDRSLDEIRRALNAGHKVDLYHVESSPEQIFKNLVKRAGDGDRTVPIETTYNAMLKSRQNVLRMAGKFGDNPNFNIHVIDNRNVDNPKFPIEGVDFIKNNPYTKDDIASFKEEAYAKLENLYDQGNGKISKEIYEGFTRRKPEAAGEKSGGRTPVRQFHGEESQEGGREEDLSEVPGIEKARKNFLNGIGAKEQSAAERAFEGYTDVSTTILEKLKGRTTVSKQFISDLTNSADLKQTERDIVRQILSEYGPKIEKKEPYFSESYVWERMEDEAEDQEMPVAQDFEQMENTEGNDKKDLAEKWLSRIAYEGVKPKIDPEGNLILYRGSFDSNKLEELYYLTADKEVAKQYGDVTEHRVDPRDVHYSQIEDNWIYDPTDHKEIKDSDVKIPVQEFADKVKAELLPLNVKSSDVYKPDTGPSHNPDAMESEGSFTPKYENISLSPESKGNVANYKENIYESPIATSAGNVHFNYNTKSYFGHTRVEDMAPDSYKPGEFSPSPSEEGTTRRIIEVQSDLYQKGRLEKEQDYLGKAGDMTIRGGSVKEAEENLALAKKNKESEGMISAFEHDLSKAKNRAIEISKLQQYNNPTAHFRMVREEVKQAAIDGKTKLQFPTGETAMKIEGLGERNRWMNVNGKMSGSDLKPEDLKVGKEITEYDRADLMPSDKWIITHVSDEPGRFQAIPKDVWDDIHETNMSESTRESALENSDRAETFDISGKVDTNNPIYRFYEKDLGRYLKNKYDAKLITDKQGVSWYEMNVPKSAANEPVTAFKKAGPIGRLAKSLEPKITIDEARAAIAKVIPEKDLNLIFSESLLDNGATGLYQRFSVVDAAKDVLKPVISLYTEGGKVSALDTYHEAFHYLFDNFMSKDERIALLDRAHEEMGILEKGMYRLKGYQGNDNIAEEYLADQYAKEEAGKSGFKGPLKDVLEKLQAIIKHIVGLIKKALKAIDDILPKKGREGGYIGFQSEENADAHQDFSKNVNEAVENDKLYDDASPVLNEDHVERLEALEERAEHLSVEKEALDQNPAKGLMMYVSKRTGQLPTVTGGPEARGEFAKRGDDIVTEYGFKSAEDAQEALDSYIPTKEAYDEKVRQFIADKKALLADFKMDIEKYGKSGPLMHHDFETLENNKGVVPPEVRGGIRSPELDFTKWHDKATIRLVRETMERNLEKVATPADAKKVQEFLIEPIRANETARAEFINEMHTKIREKMNELGIKRGSKMDRLVQIYGEEKINHEGLSRELGNNFEQVKRVEKTIEYFRRTYKDLLNQWNEKRMQFGYKPVPERGNYFRHFSDINQWTNSFGFLRSESQLPTEIAGISQHFQPGKPFTTAELRRTGDRTSYSAIGGMNNYLESVSKQMYHIDSIQRGRALSRYLRDVASKNPQLVLPNFAGNLHEYTNLVSGKASVLDRSIETGALGRPIMKAINGISSLLARNIIVGNLSVALTHLVSLPLNVATVDKGAFAKGTLMTTIEGVVRGIDKIPVINGLMSTLTSPLTTDSFTHIDGQQSDFLTRRFISQSIMPTKFDQVQHTLSYLFHVTDQFKSKIAVASKYYEGIGKGLAPKEAMAEADNYALRIIGDYSIGNKPTILSAHTTKLLAQFQLGVNDSISVLMHDIPKWGKDESSWKKTAWKTTNMFVQFAIFSFLFNQLYMKIRGSGKGIDPIDAGLTLLGLNDEGAGQDFWHRLALAGSDLAGELPFTSIFTGSFPLATALGQPITDALGQKFTSADLENLLADFASPIGGGQQIKKTIQGLLDYNAGQTTTAAGQKNVSIAKTPANLIKGLIFGPTGFTEAVSSKADTNSLMNLLNANKGQATKQTEAFYKQYEQDKADDPAKATAEWDQLVKTNPSLAKTVTTISNQDKAGITLNERLIKQLGVSDGQRAQYVYSKYIALPDQASKDALWNDYVAKKIISPAVGDQIKQLISSGAPVGTVSGQPKYQTGTTTSSRSLIQTVVTYAQALGTDPITAFSRIFTGQTIRRVDNPGFLNPDAAVVVDRMSEASSESIRQADATTAGIDKDQLAGMQLDHIIPLEAGGTNEEGNLDLVTTEQNQVLNALAETPIAKALQEGKISRANVREYLIRYKAGTLGENLTPAIQDEYKNKYGGVPITAQEIIDLINSGKAK